MKKASISPAPKGRSKSLSKVASVELATFLNQQYPKTVPIAALTAATKYFGKGRHLRKDDRIIKRLAGSGGDIATSTLLDVLSSQ
jgi:hypothetical protein